MTILEMSLGGGVLIAAILVLRRALLYRVPKWTFLLLWAAALCRLLIPLAVPSPVSVYTGAAWIAGALREEAPASGPEIPQVIWSGPSIVSPGPLPEADRTVPVAPAAPEKAETVSPLAALYLTGAALCGLFFTAAYLWALRRFWEAVPAEGDFTTRWREEHPTLLPIQIKVSRAVDAPLAYGLLRPVILLPEQTDWSDEDQLTCVLTHEYVHIRRGDLLWKLLLTAALCVHWFDPLVWAMYFCANRDLELACDERVVQILGLDGRKRYARALLAAAESGFFPLCTTYTTKNHMEERIRAVMKIKKQSLAAILAALLLVAGVTAVFATSGAPGPKDISGLPQAVQTDPDPAPVPADKSAPDDRVHPVTPADTSTSDDNRVHPITPTDTSTLEDSRIHPVTGQPGDTSAQDTPAGTGGKFFNREDVEFWGLPDGPIAAGTMLSAHSEEEYREMIRQLRLRGYSGFFDLTGQPDDDWYIVILGPEFDGVQRNLTPPEGIMPDWTYPVNSKGMTYGNILGGPSALGYYPDLIAAVATNGAEGYMTAEDTLHGQNGRYPVYDVEFEHIVGYFETGSQISSEVQAKIDSLKNDFKTNSKGQTYGISSIVSPEDYIPNLINVPFIKDGKNDPSIACYVRKEDAAPYRYPGEINDPDDAMDYMAWLEKQPYSVTLPAYDMEGDPLGTTEVILNDGVRFDTGEKDLETAREEVKNDRVHPITGGQS